MKTITKVLLFLSAILIPSHLLAQAEAEPPRVPDLPKFYFDALSFASDQPHSSRLDLYVEVPHETIHFTKENDVFRASYELSVNLYDSTDVLVNEKWWTEKVETQNYDESVSPVASNLTQKSFILSPGKYSIVVQVKDKETNKLSRQTRKLEVSDFDTAPFGISDIMLVNRLGTENGQMVIYPNISGNVADLSDGFHIFFEAYNHINADSALIAVAIHNVKGDVVQSDSFVQPLAVGKKSCFHEEKISNLIAGDYLIEVTAVPSGVNSNVGDRDISVSMSRSFVIRWRGMPVTIVDLDLAIDQLQYLTEKEKIDEIKKAPEDQKRELFREFWKKKDPTPNTERNEMMEEYYARVAYATKHFSHYIDGWKTDMGMIYIIFGAPNNVERHPFDIDAKPYEIWTYYELNREFIFVDATGFGDYRLQNPIWDLARTRPR